MNKLILSLLLVLSLDAWPQQSTDYSYVQDFRAVTKLADVYLAYLGIDVATGGNLGGNSAGIYQQQQADLLPGTVFSLDQQQRGDLRGANLASIDQSGGLNNVANIWQTGVKNLASIQQIGDDNAARLLQSGTYHEAILRQQGSFNRFAGVMTGDGAHLEVSQLGASNTLQAVMESNSNLIVQQIGPNQSLSMHLGPGVQVNIVQSN